MLLLLSEGNSLFDLAYGIFRIFHRLPVWRIPPTPVSPSSGRLRLKPATVLGTEADLSPQGTIDGVDDLLPIPGDTAFDGEVIGGVTGPKDGSAEPGRIHLWEQLMVA